MWRGKKLGMRLLQSRRGSLAEEAADAIRQIVPIAISIIPYVYFVFLWKQ